MIFDLAGVTDPTTKTGINAGQSMWTWFCQIAAVIAGKRAGRRPFLLGVWPILLLCLAACCTSLGVYQETGSTNRSASVAVIVMVWFYLGAFNFSNPVIYSYTPEVQTFEMRSKGLLLWNQSTQLFGAYTGYVDSVALNRIGWKYFFVYMPLVIIQWCLCYRCECFPSLLDSHNDTLADSLQPFLLKDMVEVRGLTLEQIAEAFDGPGSFTTRVKHSMYMSQGAVRNAEDPEEALDQPDSPQDSFTKMELNRDESSKSLEDLDEKK